MQEDAAVADAMSAPAAIFSPTVKITLLCVVEPIIAVLILLDLITTTSKRNVYDKDSYFYPVRRHNP